MKYVPFKSSSARTPRLPFRAWVGAVLSWSMLVMGAGCRTAQTAAPVENRTFVESVAFTTDMSRIRAVDSGTSALVSSNFSITLANDRIGLIQTDYVPVAVVREALIETTAVTSRALDDLLMRITVNAEERDRTTFVQVKGSFQRIGGAPTANDEIVGLYWMERVTDRMARGVNATYRPQVSDSVYAHVLSQSGDTDSSNTSGLRRPVKAIGLVAAALFAMTLLLGTFGPGSTPQPAPSE